MAVGLTFWVEMEETVGKAIGTVEAAWAFPWQRTVVGSGLSELWVVLFSCPVTFTARGMRYIRYTLPCFASFHAFRLLRACGFYM